MIIPINTIKDISYNSDFTYGFISCLVMIIIPFVSKIYRSRLKMESVYKNELHDNIYRLEKSIENNLLHLQELKEEIVSLKTTQAVNNEILGIIKKKIDFNS